jgi:hypothetical protein
MEKIRAINSLQLRPASRKAVRAFFPLEHHLVFATTYAFIAFFEHCWQKKQCPTFSLPFMQSKKTQETTVTIRFA